MTSDQETEQIIREAKGLRIELREEEVRWEGDFPTIDGMDAYEWLDAMTGGRGCPS